MDINLLTSLNDNIRIDRNKCTPAASAWRSAFRQPAPAALPLPPDLPFSMNCQGTSTICSKPDGQRIGEMKEAVPFGGIWDEYAQACEAACNRSRWMASPCHSGSQALPLRPGGTRRCGGTTELPDPCHCRRRSAGLTAAFYLRAAGLKVTLFDRESEPGASCAGHPEFVCLWKSWSASFTL